MEIVFHYRIFEPGFTERFRQMLQKKLAQILRNSVIQFCRFNVTFLKL